MVRRKGPESHVSQERWLVSYADFITLLFAFFTSLYAISTVDADKAGKMLFSTRAAFNLDFFPSEHPTLGVQGRGGVRLNNQTISPRVDKDPAKVQERLTSKEIERILAALVETLERGALREGGTVIRDERGIIVSLPASGLFPPGSAKLVDSAVAQLDAILSKMVMTGRAIEIEGHTDDRPVAGGLFRSNWELSAARALSVAEYVMAQFAYPGDRLKVSAMAHHQPVANNDTAEGRDKNRRVDVVLLTDDR
ncbi:MAG: OmpA family protein [Deltaproteobacteria bacterium]|nr:OmpA family protein [Deltaproteobacteria bacterium]